MYTQFCIIHYRCVHLNLELAIICPVNGPLNVFLNVFNFFKDSVMIPDEMRPPGAVGRSQGRLLRECGFGVWPEAIKGCLGSVG